MNDTFAPAPGGTFTESYLEMLEPGDTCLANGQPAVLLEKPVLDRETARFPSRISIAGGPPEEVELRHPAISDFAPTNTHRNGVFRFAEPGWWNTTASPLCASIDATTNGLIRLGLNPVPTGKGGWRNHPTIAAVVDGAGPYLAADPDSLLAHQRLPIIETKLSSVLRVTATIEPLTPFAHALLDELDRNQPMPAVTLWRRALERSLDITIDPHAWDAVALTEAPATDLIATLDAAQA